jgi:hypothetical protein
MTDSEMRELDEWIQREVLKCIYIEVHPTTNYGHALMVLEKCGEEHNVITGRTKDGNWVASEIDERFEIFNDVEADTLPLAIARFSRKLFTA